MFYVVLRLPLKRVMVRLEFHVDCLGAVGGVVMRLVVPVDCSDLVGWVMVSSGGVVMRKV